ncbi:hypothetical protein BaRGS_00020788 [Batillaria attramentaria]|uniref:PIN domain-containing protein n=1 Tax=Batillaria attramentaria TaxID=370345 RepID=A0ABD0KLW8_9CAEN
MAEKDVVRITFKELESIAEGNREDVGEEKAVKGGDSSRRRKKTKRPEQAIYRPGQFRSTKKDKDASNTEERNRTDEENWELEIEPVGARELAVTTDEDSSHGSKENSVEKDVSSDSGRDMSRLSSPHLSAAQREKNEAGRKRSKYPDIQIYVPKGRLQEQESHRSEDQRHGEAGYSDSEFSPRKVDVNARFGALQVTVLGDRLSPVDQGSSTGDRPAGCVQDSESLKDNQSSHEHSDAGMKGDHLGDRGEHADKRTGVGNGEEGNVSKTHPGDGGSQGRRVDPKRREQQGERHHANRYRDASERDWEDRSGAWRHGANRESVFKNRDEQRMGRGRGRHRTTNYNRSSSSEAVGMAKSMEFNQQGGQWSADKNVQQSGTFPRAKGGKGRGQEAVGMERDQGTKHAFSSMRRQRERSGSISSDTSGGSDLSWEDLEAEMEEAAKSKPDWYTQVEQHLEEVARQVQNSTQRLTDSIDNCFDPYAIPTDEVDVRPPAHNHQQAGGLNRNLSASSDRIFSQEYRGRKKDRRRRGSRSKNSSRDSSIHSNPRDDDLWPSAEKKTPRKRHRKRHSSAGPSGRVGTVEGQRAAESLRILVGKNKEKRQVMVDGKGGGGGGDSSRRQRQHSGSDAHKKTVEHYHQHRDRQGGDGGGRGGDGRGPDRRKNDDRAARNEGNQQPQHGGFSRFAPSPVSRPDSAPPPSVTHSGGLIKLPVESHLDRPQPSYGHAHGQGYSQERSEEGRYRRTSGQGYGGGQGHNERCLYDPKNPSKPIMVPDSRPLKFHDPEETHSPQENFTPPPPPVSHSPGPTNSPVMGPGFPPFFPPHPGFMYPPPPHMRMPYPGFPPAPPPNHPMFYAFQPQQPTTDGEDGYYNRELEQMVSGMSRMQCRTMAEQILRDTAPLDCQLGNILSRGQLGEDGERRVKQLRLELQRRYERIILLDIDVANQRGVEQQLWRSVYYNVIEGLRRHSPDSSETDPTTKQALADILDEGTSFYESLLNKLQSTYSFSLDSLLEEGAAPPENVNRGVRLAILSAQRTMMFLGDIARYREQASHSTNYGRARHWYVRAQKLAPKNGRPYNQLAILAVYTRRKLDAVYYYQRSLAASNPILTARESLMSLFDEVRRKEEAVEQKRLEEVRRRRKRRTAASHSQPRVEVWIAPDGSSSRDPQSDRDSGDDDLSSLSAIELNKRFVLTFLNVHGKLFTKINFEVFAESAGLMLQEWRLLLHHSPTVLSSNRLLQIMAINMFSIDNTALKDESLEASCRSLLQEHAVEVGLDMFGILVARVTELFNAQMAAASGSSSRQQVTDDLRQLLPGVKVWVDWMMCHSSLWNPQPSLRPPDIGPQIDVWQNIAKLCNTLKQVDTNHATLYPDKREGCEPLVLMEDTMMSGFVPLLSAPCDTVYVTADEDKELAQDCLRLAKVQLFGDYLCGVEPPMLAFDVERECLYSIAPAPVKSEEKLAGSDEDAKSETEDVIVESEESGEDGDETPGETIQQLKARKAELSRRVEDHARDKHNLQALVEQGKPAKLELEVRPRFLVTDTNCFIDHLPTLRSLIATGIYTLVVPLVVVNELDGLAKGSQHGRGNHRDDDSPEHASMVMRHATQALAYLESEFKARNTQLRVQTSKGSVLETLAFRSEESDNTGNNDDLILSCCLHYCKDMARDFMPRDKDSPVRLFRDVVLLTDDRNLRLKAHTSNVPVKDVPAFCRWSKVT